MGRPIKKRILSLCIMVLLIIYANLFVACGKTDTRENASSHTCIYSTQIIYKEKDSIGVTIIDISTGKFVLTEFNQNSLTKLNDYLINMQ